MDDERNLDLYCLRELQTVRRRTTLVQTSGDVSTSVATGGTTGTLCKFTGAFTIGDSIISESGTVATIAGTAVITGATLDIDSDSAELRFGDSQDAILARGVANRLEVRNGINAQNFFVYQTYTDASNYSRLQIQCSSTQYGLFGQAGGSGTERNIRIGGNGGNDYWQFKAGSTTDLTPADNGTYSIGTTSKRVKDIFLGGYVQLGITDTDGTVEGALWYDASEDKLKFKTAGGVETITSA